MKKFIKLVFINLCLLTIFVAIINCIFLFKENKINQKYPFRMYIPYEKYIYYLFRDKKYIRTPEGLNFNKKPIILYGCSFVYGYQLDNNETFSKKLSEQSKRPIHNYAISSSGIQNILFLMERKNHFQEFEEPEYIIYTFIDDHIRRLYQPCNTFDSVEHIKYKETNNELVRDNSILKFLHLLFIYNKIKKHYFYNFIFEQKKDKNFDIIKKHLIQAKKYANKNYPNTKFVILLYPSGNENEKSWYTFTSRWKELEQEDFIIYNLNDLTKENLQKNEYKIADKAHPNGKAWDIIVPALIKELKY